MNTLSSVPSLNENPEHRRILIIEDSIVAGMLMSAIIERKQPLFDVRVRKSMKGGMEEFESFKPDVVILDLDLPDSRAAASLLQIPVFRTSAKVMVVTGSHEHEAAAKELGANDFLLKAIGEDSSAFIHRINTLAEC